eukprot:c20009_g1_i3.p1 GENE.c20009_g1_i3~~c20009_g1_i3.p1  ORF type:complete len:139 (-),score=8.28 c20009_g1_i3:85-501(-)
MNRWCRLPCERIREVGMFSNQFQGRGGGGGQTLPSEGGLYLGVDQIFDRAVEGVPSDRRQGAVEHVVANVQKSLDKIVKVWVIAGHFKIRSTAIVDTEARQEEGANDSARDARERGEVREDQLTHPMHIVLIHLHSNI